MFSTNEEYSGMSQVKQDLRAVARARILFGHRSVGRDILAGIESLSKEAGVPVRVVAIDALPPDDGPGVFHAEIGKNGYAQSKCEAFARLLARSKLPRYDLAMMKFCYVDLGKDAQLEATKLLDRYAAMVDALRGQRFRSTLVHASLPLRSDPNSWKTPVKRLMGRATYEDADNILRNLFNEQLRSRYGHEPFFDLARAESTLPSGKRSMFEQDGRQIFTLATRYTNDGGHLNEEGRRRMALELVRVWADSLGHEASSRAIGGTTFT